MEVGKSVFLLHEKCNSNPCVLIVYTATSFQLRDSVFPKEVRKNQNFIRSMLQRNFALLT